MNNEQDAIFVRNFSLVLVFLAVVGIIAFILAKIVYADFLKTQNNDVVMSERTAPIGQANVDEPFMMGGDAAESAGGEAMAAAEPSDPGAATYGKICFTCHDAGIGNAPKIGDAAAWDARKQKGTEMLVMNAINGISDVGVMPAKGGLPSLTDDEVRAAVMFMLAGGATSDEASAAPEAAPAEAVAEAAPAADGRGKEVYDQACFVCHATGVAGAPKLGDSAGWAPRIEQGMETLYTHAIKGFMGEAGLMPPKGGRTDFSDDDVKAAVDYMVNAN